MQYGNHLLLARTSSYHPVLIPFDEHFRWIRHDRVDLVTESTLQNLVDFFTFSLRIRFINKHDKYNIIYVVCSGSYLFLPVFCCKGASMWSTIGLKRCFNPGEDSSSMSWTIVDPTSFPHPFLLSLSQGNLQIGWQTKAMLLQCKLGKKQTAAVQK